MKRIEESDLMHVLQHTRDIWEPVKGKSVFITGGTGFFGKWLLESFLYINKKLALNATVLALSRDPDKFLDDFPFYRSEPSIKFIKGDVQNFEFPKDQFDFIIHAATDADAKLNIEHPLLMLDTITVGTKHILDFSKQQTNLKAFLFTSSGAVYGKQPSEITHTKETDSFFIDISNPNSAYAEGKKLAELYCAIYCKEFGIPVKIARCFAFVGPYLPLDKHFAIGNFIQNGLANEDIIIKGDGTPQRSYLYAADLAIWLWTILLKGQVNEPYNVGSEESLSLKEIAEIVSKVFNNGIGVKILENTIQKPVERYVPDTTRSKMQLDLMDHIKIDTAVKKTRAFLIN